VRRTDWADLALNDEGDQSSLSPSYPKISSIDNSKKCLALVDSPIRLKPQENVVALLSLRYVRYVDGGFSLTRPSI
jgi:hypothetical protein